MKMEFGEPLDVALSVLIPEITWEGKMQSAIYTPSPIRQQTAFMAALTNLRLEYEKNMALLYASQAEYKAAYSLLETVKEFGSGDLDHLDLSITTNDVGILLVVTINDQVETLFKSLEKNGISYAARLSKSGQQLHIAVEGYPLLVFIAPAESITLMVPACAA